MSATDATFIDADALVRGAAAAHLWADAYAWQGRELEPAGLDPEYCDDLADAPDQANGGPWSTDARAAVSDVIEWAHEHAETLRAYMSATGRDAEHVGHDFALSRGGHGTGLWDRGASAPGEILHQAAKTYGELTLLVKLDSDGEVLTIDKL